MKLHWWLHRDKEAQLSSEQGRHTWNLKRTVQMYLFIKQTPGVRKQIYGYQRGMVQFSSVESSSVAQSCRTLYDPMNLSTPGLPVHHHLPEFTETHVHRVGDAIQPSHSLSSPSPPALNPSQHQGLFKWVSFSHQVAKVLEFQYYHQSFQWIFRTLLC